MQIALLLATGLALHAAGPSSGTPDADDVVAAPTTDVLWVDTNPGKDRTVVTSDGLSSLAESFGAPSKSGLDEWRGRPVVIVTLPERSHTESIPLLEMLARANVDRELVVATLLPAPPSVGTERDDPEAKTRELDRRELERRLRLAAGLPEGSDIEIPRPSEKLAVGYVDAGQPWTPTQHVVATVIGPSGERIGEAKLPEDEDGLFDLVRIAMNRYGAPALESDLPGPLRAAQSLYFSGDWDKARRTATKLAKRLVKKDPEAAAFANALASSIDDFERELHTQLIDADSEFPKNMTIAKIATAARRGFPKGRSVEFVDSMLERRKKTMQGAVALEACLAYMEALPGRPALFAEVADGPAKKHAKALEKIAARANSYSGPITKRIEALLLRHEASPKKR